MLSGRTKHRILNVLRPLLGPKLLRHLLLRRNVRHYRRTGVTFVHVPKNAGTSVSRTLYGQSLGHYTARELVAFCPDLFDTTISFAVLRDPVKRVVSAWRYCCTGGSDQSWKGRWPEFETPEFQDFEWFATDWLPRQDPQTLNFVLRRQTDFLLDAQGKVMVQNLIPIDRINVELPRILGDRPDMAIEVGVLNKNKARSNDPTALSDRAMAAIQEFYAGDFALFYGTEDREKWQNPSS